MKLFQQLLVAPAALGLLAPMAAHAAELNLNGVNQYAASQDQVTSVTQFSDVRPTDWAYQALSNLISRYGCVAGYPNGTFKGGQAMTRYEAAALLNACLDRVSETTDELKRLVAEFSKELAVLRGRVDGLEAKVGVLQAQQFSTTTKLKGQATFVLGANAFSGNSNTALLNANGLSNNQNFGAAVFNYDVRLNFDTSFTGKDLFRTRLRAGNFGFSPYGSGLTTMEVAFQDPLASNIVDIDRLFYSFPVGSQITAAVGGRVRVDDPGMLGLWPSVYPDDTILDFFTYAGSPGAYNLLALGGGAGFVYSPNWAKGLTISQNYVSTGNGIIGRGPGVGNPSLGGIMTGGAQSAAVTQIAYAGSNTPWIGGNYGLAFAYTYGQNLPPASGTNLATGIASTPSSSSNNLTIGGYWAPAKSGIIPSISWGVGTGTYTLNPATTPTAPNVLSTWYTGLQWTDAFVKGNSAGMAVGQAPYVSKVGASFGGGTPYDSNYLWEWWYKFQVTDNISVTPAIYYISNYNGQAGATNFFTTAPNKTDNVFGGLLKATFKF